MSSVSLNIFPELLSNEETTLQKISLPLLTQCTITIRTYERYLFQLAEWFSHCALLDRGGPHVSSSGPDPYSRTFVYLLRSYYQDTDSLTRLNGQSFCVSIITISTLNILGCLFLRFCWYYLPPQTVQRKPRKLKVPAVWSSSL